MKWLLGKTVSASFNLMELNLIQHFSDDGCEIFTAGHELGRARESEGQRHEFKVADSVSAFECLTMGST